MSEISKSIALVLDEAETVIDCTDQAIAGEILGELIDLTSEAARSYPQRWPLILFRLITRPSKRSKLKIFGHRHHRLPQGTIRFWGDLQDSGSVKINQSMPSRSFELLIWHRLGEWQQKRRYAEFLVFRIRLQNNFVTCRNLSCRASVFQTSFSIIPHNLHVLFFVKSYTRVKNWKCFASEEISSITDLFAVNVCEPIDYFGTLTSYSLLSKSKLKH